MGSKVTVFGRRGQWTVYMGSATVGRFTVKRDAEAAARAAAGK